jgi:WD40 repeat protein/serine/threonine protein kinase
MAENKLLKTLAEGRFEQVLAEILQNEEEGTPIDLEQAVQTHPDLESSLREYFRNRAGFDRLASILAPPPAMPDLPIGSRIDGYEIIEEIDRGGRGIVYRVRDAELNRSLAVKVLLPKLRNDADAVRRFLEERQVTGQLQHPGIVPVHSVGNLPDGRPYFAMKLVQGQTLAALLAERGLLDLGSPATPGPTTLATECQTTTGSGNQTPGPALVDTQCPPNDLPRFLGIFQQICQAVAYAHSRGVIHRDLKPKNVMVGAFAEVQVMDWGLAKVLANADFVGDPNTIHTVRTGATGVSSAHGMVAGTYAYMSQEQAKGHVDRIDERTDVFGLGAVLCEVLTGLPPYAGTSARELYQRAAVGALAGAFHRLNHSGADAELIALAKDCLAAERDARPRDAGVVAQRVSTYLANVQERLHRAELERAAADARAREERRRRRWQGTAALIAVLAFAMIACSLYKALVLADENGDLAKKNGDLAQEKTNEATRAGEQEGIAKEKSRIAKENENEALRKERLQRRRYYISRINLAQQSLNNFLVAPTLKYLDETIPKPDEEDFRGFEWTYLDRQCRKEVRTLQGHSGFILCVRYSPDGKVIATGEQDGTVRIWDATTGSEILSIKRTDGGAIGQIAFSPDGKRIAAASGWSLPLKVWEVATGQEAMPFKEGGSGVSFSPDGKLIATHRKEAVVVLNSMSGEVLQTIPNPNGKPPQDRQQLHPIGGLALAFSPDSKTLAYASIDNATQKPAVTIWDLTSNNPRYVLLGHRDYIQCVVFNPQGRMLASGSWDGTVRLWDTATGKENSVLKGFKGDVYDVAFNPRRMQVGLPIGSLPIGSLLCACNFNRRDSDDTPRTARIWRVETGMEPATLHGYLDGGMELATLKGHLGTVTSIAFSPRDNQLATAGLDGTVRVWELADSGDAKTVFQSPTHLYLAGCGKGAVCAFGSTLYFQGLVPQVRDLASGTELLKIDKPTSNLAMSADGTVLAIVSPPPVGDNTATGEITLREIPSGVVRQTLSGLPQFVKGEPLPGFLSGLALSSDGKLLASAGKGATILIRDTYTGNELYSLPAPGGTSQIAFHPKASQLACINGDGKVRVWDLETRVERLVLSVGRGVPLALSFSPDGRLLAIAENENWPFGAAVHAVVRMRDVSSGKEHLMLKGHNSFIRSLAFHPDGRRFVTGSDDHTAKLWDLETGQELLTFGNHTHGVHGVAFTGDGHYLLTAEGPIWGTRVGALGRRTSQFFTVKCWNATPHPSRARDEKLLAVLSGKSELGSAEELMELARFATHSRGQFAATARLFIDCLGRHPDWASYVADRPPFLGDHPSYYAAASALMAAGGEGNGAELTDEQRPTLRKQALTWMREHLAFCENRIRNKGFISQVHYHLAFAASDNWFAGVRDEKQFANLPEPERSEWSQFWTDLASLREKCKLGGEWFMEGRKEELCAVFQQGRVLLLVNERGEFATAMMTDAKKFTVKGWGEGLSGEFVDEGKKITWSNGTTWLRLSEKTNNSP